ncbi:MAG: hypothetical protein NC086_02505 [Alistipes sp.]|nr:hypothetical protein [Alistipes sp.]
MNSHNGELLGAYGNFVNRSLAFITKYYDGVVPHGKNDPVLDKQLEELFVTVGGQIEGGLFKEALDTIFEFIRKANKFFDREQPWITRTANADLCANTLYQCVQIIANLAVLLYPFLPFSSAKACGWLDINNNWEKHVVSAGFRLPKIEVLFQRIDKKVIETETQKLNGN